MLPFEIIAQQYDQEEAYFAHLYSINKEWINHIEASPEGKIVFNSDRERIQLHLRLVCQHLKENPPINLEESRLSNRIKLISKLEEYASLGVFPTNLYHEVRQPYFVDDFGVHCAVGYMMHVSGDDELVSRIRNEHNFDYIKDIKTEGVTEWASINGFTVEELKWIQPGYPPANNIEMLGNGTNGSVKGFWIDIYNNNRLILFGDFSELDNEPCSNLGIYENDQLYCFGSGLLGNIVNVFSKNDGVYVTGTFYDGGVVYPMAKYDNGSWNYISIPTRENATSTASSHYFYNGQYVIAIDHSSLSGIQEIWSYSYSGVWQKQAEIVGTVHDIESGYDGLFFAGQFDYVIPYSTLGPGTQIPTNNAVSYSFNGNWTPITGGISNTVHSISTIGTSTYFAGTCSTTENVCVTKYLNGTLQPILLYNQVGYDQPCVINQLAYENNSAYLTLGGNFNISPMGVGTAGNNLAKYNLVNGSLTVLAQLNDEVNAVLYDGQDLFIGGDFTTNLGSTSLNHLGTIVSTVSIDEFGNASSLKTYPNPFTSSISVEGVEDQSKYKLLDMTGQIVKEGSISNGQITDLDDLSTGNYILTIQTEKGIISVRVMK